MAGEAYDHTIIFTYGGEDRFQLQFTVSGVQTTTKCQVSGHSEVGSNWDREVPYVKPVYLVDTLASRNMALNSPLAHALVGMVRDNTGFIGMSVCYGCSNRFEMIFPEEIPLDKRYNKHVHRTLRGIQEIVYA